MTSEPTGFREMAGHRAEDDFTVESNREDLDKMEKRHVDGYAFG